MAVRVLNPSSFDWKLTDTDTRFFQYNDGTEPKGLFYCRNVCQQYRRLLLGFAACTVPEQDHGWQIFAAQCQQRAEIAIRGYEDVIFGFSARQYDLIRASIKPVVAHMHRVMAGPTKAVRDERRQGVVD